MTSPRWRFALALLNAALAASLLGLAAWTFLVRHPRPADGPPARPKPGPFVLPGGMAAGEDLVQVISREIDVPPVARPTVREDIRAQEDPEGAFDARYRVVLATLDIDPAERSCIVSPRS